MKKIDETIELPPKSTEYSGKVVFHSKTFQYFATSPSPALGCYIDHHKVTSQSELTVDLHCFENFEKISCRDYWEWYEYHWIEKITHFKDFPACWQLNHQVFWFCVHGDSFQQIAASRNQQFSLLNWKKFGMSGWYCQQCESKQVFWGGNLKTCFFSWS